MDPHLHGFSAANWSPMTARGVLIGLDVSSDARDSLPEQLRLTAALLDVLPADVPAVVTVLGADRAWPPAHLQDADWLASQADRLAIVAPAMELAAQRDLTLVALAGGPVPDIEDLTPEERERLLVAPLADGLTLPSGTATVPPRAAEIADRLVRRTESVWVGAPGCIPVDWQTDGWKLDLTPDGRLGVRPEGAPSALTLEYYGAPPLADGRPLTPAEGGTPRWTALTEPEQEIMRALLAGEPFTCLICSRTHPPQTLLCPNGSGILEPPVLPSTPPGGGLLQAVRTESGWCVRRVRGCLPLPDGDAALYTGGAPLRLARQPDATWRRTAPLPNVVDCGAYVVMGG